MGWLYTCGLISNKLNQVWPRGTNTIMGADSSYVRISKLQKLSADEVALTCFAYMSPTVPPATLRKAEPARPSRNLPISMVCMFCAKAHINIKTKKNVKEQM
jgi:hypothetical protein